MVFFPEGTKHWSWYYLCSQSVLFRDKQVLLNAIFPSKSRSWKAGTLIMSLLVLQLTFLHLLVTIHARKCCNSQHPQFKYLELRWQQHLIWGKWTSNWLFQFFMCSLRLTSYFLTILFPERCNETLWSKTFLEILHAFSHPTHFHKKLTLFIWVLGRVSSVWRCTFSVWRCIWLIILVYIFQQMSSTNKGPMPAAI